MRDQSDSEIARRLRRMGHARVNVAVDATLFGPVALTFSLRRVGWQVRYEAWMFENLDGACEQIRRILNGNRKLIHRFALVLEAGVVMRLTLPKSGAHFLESLSHFLHASLERRGFQLRVSVDFRSQIIDATLRRASDDSSPQSQPPSGANQANVVPFPQRLASKYEPDVLLGVAFFDEPALTALAMRLYPLGVRRLGDLGHERIARLHHSEVGNARRRALIMLEGWLVENELDFI